MQVETYANNNLTGGGYRGVRAAVSSFTRSVLNRSMSQSTSSSDEGANVMKSRFDECAEEDISDMLENSEIVLRTRKARRREQLVRRRADFFKNDLLAAVEYNALLYVAQKTQPLAEEAIITLQSRFENLGFNPMSDLYAVLDYFATDVPAIVHFRPVRTLRKLVDDGFLRSFFELPHPSSERVRRRNEVEGDCFGNTYIATTPAVHRVKYGCLNFARSPSGVDYVANEFGDSYFILKKDVKARMTCAVTDTYLQQIVATCENYAFVLDTYTDDELRWLMHTVRPNLYPKPSTATHCYAAPKTYYKEIHVHGKLNLRLDVECLMLNPIHRLNTVVQEEVERLKRKYGIPVYYIENDRMVLPLSYSSA